MRGGALEQAERAGLPLPEDWADRFPQDPAAPSMGTFRGIGRMLVKEIRRSEIVFEVENFGVPEQVVLRMRRRRDGSGGF